VATVSLQRTNYALYPHAAVATGWSYTVGTTETGTTAVMALTDTPDGNIGYMRRTVTVAKTAGSSGWTFGGTSGAPHAGVAGDVVHGQMWIRSSTAVTVSFRVATRLGTTTVTQQDSAAYNLAANVWTRMDSTVTSTGVYDNYYAWPYMVGANILPSGATMDVTQVMFELGTSGTYFDGFTAAASVQAYSPPATLIYGWTGVPGASVSTESLSIPLQDYQIQLPDGSIVGAGANGISYTNITGLRALPTLRASDTDQPQADGALPGMSFLGERLVQITWQITAPPGGLEPAVSLLSRNWQNVPDPTKAVLRGGDYLTAVGLGLPVTPSMLQVKLPGRQQPLLLLGRPSKFDLPVDVNYQYQYLSFTSEWAIPDGVLYDAGVQTASCALPSAAAGLTFPASAPFVFGGSNGGTASVNNGGAYPAWPVFVLWGPIKSPKITNLSSGLSMQLNIALAAGDRATIDMQGKVVTLNGANRNNTVDTRSSFFSAAPGTNTFGLSSADAVTVTGQMAAYLLNTYSVI
jgi:hypothetical protein